MGDTSSPVENCFLLCLVEVEVEVEEGLVIDAVNINVAFAFILGIVLEATTLSNFN